MTEYFKHIKSLGISILGYTSRVALIAIFIIFATVLGLSVFLFIDSMQDPVCWDHGSAINGECVYEWDVFDVNNYKINVPKF